MSVFPQRLSFLKVSVRRALVLFLYFIFPFFLAKFLKVNPVKPLFLFYLVNSLILFYFYKRAFFQGNSFKLRMQDLQEKQNLLGLSRARELNNSASLKEKDRRYRSLEKILERINQTLELDAVAEALSAEAFSLIGRGKGVCSLYLIDSQTQRPVLFKTRKEDPGLTVRAKEGDMLDSWVLKHASPLLIEDIKVDFRFDFDKLTAQDTRPFASLISAPFLSENRQLGLLRLDCEVPRAYTQDDLRYLVSIADLGGVAIENSELFKRTQDLARHDALTGFYTKSYFRERLEEEVKRSLASGAALSLLMLDIDFFKDYNDRFGHTAGDIALEKLSRVISSSLSEADSLISRFGGEEFCIAILGVDKIKAFAISDLLRRNVEKERMLLRRVETSITVSIGLAGLPEDTLDAEGLIRNADKMMYQAKKEGRNRICCI